MKHLGINHLKAETNQIVQFFYGKYWCWSKNLGIYFRNILNKLLSPLL